MKKGIMAFREKGRKYAEKERGRMCLCVALRFNHFIFFPTQFHAADVKTLAKWKEALLPYLPAAALTASTTATKSSSWKSKLRQFIGESTDA